MLPILIVSCDKNFDYQIELLKSDVKNINVDDLKLSSDSDTINEKDAINVAKLFNVFNGSTTKSNISKEIENVVPITDDLGNVAMYAVNYKFNNGYLLISASKNYYPVLADVDKGNFNISTYHSGVSVILAEYLHEISNIELVPQHIVQNMRKMWHQYEKTNSDSTISTKLNEFDTFIVNSLQYWENNSHDFYPLSDALLVGNLPDDIYQAFCAAAEGSAHPNYDYMTYSYVVETINRTDYNTLNYKLNTLWRQDPPYNASIPSTSTSKPPVGCGAIAAGQIMKYYQWPNNVNWNDIPNSLYGTNGEETTLSRFLASLAEDIRTSSTIPINESSVQKVRNTLINKYNYSCSNVDGHNRNSVISSLASDKLVYMTGKNVQAESGHAWVCDGSQSTSYSIQYTLYVIETSNNLQYIQACDPYIESEQYYYLHFNWGKGGDENGWYIDGPYSTLVPDNCNTERFNIVNICPSNIQ